ncbi:MAG: CBS domain-containing protein, partial [Rhodospirillales bacterium]
LRESYWGVPVADGGGKYLGMVTLRRLADCGLGGSAAALTTVPTLRFMRNGIASARSHFQEIAHRGASEFLDPDVQALDEPVSVPQALMLAFRGQLAAPIVRRQDGRLIGVLRLDDLLRAIVSPS